MKRKVLVVAVAALAGLTMLAQEKKDAPKKAATGGILHPEMTVENGTYEKPMATIGTKPDQPWTATSVAAGVDSKPEPGTPNINSLVLVRSWISPAISSSANMGRSIARAGKNASITGNRSACLRKMAGSIC